MLLNESFNLKDSSHSMSAHFWTVTGSWCLDNDNLTENRRLQGQPSYPEVGKGTLLYPISHIPSHWISQGWPWTHLEHLTLDNWTNTITIAAATFFFHVLRVALDGDSEAKSGHLPRVRGFRFFRQPSPDLVTYPFPRAFDFCLLTFGQFALLVLLTFASLTGFFVASLLSFLFTVGL
jgi:hypothetical protein